MDLLDLNAEYIAGSCSQDSEIDDSVLSMPRDHGQKFPILYIYMLHIYNLSRYWEAGQHQILCKQILLVIFVLVNMFRTSDPHACLHILSLVDRW